MQYFKKIIIVFLLTFIVSLGLSMSYSMAANEQTKGSTFFDKFRDTNQYTSVPAVTDAIENINKTDTSNTIFVLIIMVANIFRWAVTILAVFFIVMAGVKMVTSGGNEENAGKQIKMIINLVAGIIVMNTAYIFVDMTFGANYLSIQTPIDFSQKIVFPLIDMFLNFLAAMAIVFIIYYAFRIVASPGNEEKRKEGISKVINTIMGIAVILGSKALVGIVYGLPTNTNKTLTTDLSKGIQLIMNIVNYAIGFFAFIAVIMLIYGGVLIIMGGYKEENRTKGTKVITYTLISIFILMGIYAFIATLVKLNT